MLTVLSDLYQDRVILGHGGNTAGFSSILTLISNQVSLPSFLTNQQYENYLKNSELIYGNKATTSEKIKQSLNRAFIAQVAFSPMPYQSRALLRQ